MTLRISGKTLGFALVAILLCILAYLQLPRFVGYFGGHTSRVSTSGSVQRIVVVDVSRILNAQRALASRLTAKRLQDSSGSGNSGNADDSQQSTSTASTLAQTGRLTNKVIRQVAGANTIVLVKQAVVSYPGGKMPDITDDVLDQLGLPKNAPTARNQINEDTQYPTAMTTNPAMSNAISVNQSLLRKRRQDYLSEQESQNAIP